MSEPSQRQQRVVQEAMSWLGTPYHHCADIKGPQGGVDCAMLLVRVYTACGLVPLSFEPRPYSPDWHLHQAEPIFQAWLEQYGDRVVCPSTEPANAHLQPGDVLCWRYGRGYSHGAVYVGGDAGHIVHALRPAGAVVLGSVFEAELRARQRLAYRIRGLA